MKILYTTKFGSHLYGTNTPTSDVDLKSIVLPDIYQLLANVPAKNVVQKTNKIENTANTANDVDHEYVPVQTLLRDFVRGQTYAYEIVYAFLGELISPSIRKAYTATGITTYPVISGPDGLSNMLRELVEYFQTSNVKAMTSYAMNQANIYSLKGERLTVVREVLGLVSPPHVWQMAKTQQLDDVRFGALFDNAEWLAQLNHLTVKYPKYLRIGTYDAGQKGYPNIQPCLFILEKIYPFTAFLPNVIRSLNGVLVSYGDRAKAATEDFVDWKAMMHAVRISRFAIEVISNRTNMVKYPLDADTVKYLLSIKRGEIPVESVTAEINSNLETLLDLSKKSTLPTAEEIQDEFEEWIRERMFNLYAASGVKMPG